MSLRMSKPGKVVKSARLTDDERVAILGQYFALRSAGVTVMEACRAVHTTYLTVQKWAKWYGIEWDGVLVSFDVRTGMPGRPRKERVFPQELPAYGNRVFAC